MHLSVFNGTEKVKIMLKDVLYVPKLQNKLFPLHLTEIVKAVLSETSPVNLSQESEDNTNQMLELIHSKICGPMNFDSVGSSRYCVVFY